MRRSGETCVGICFRGEIVFPSCRAENGQDDLEEAIEGLKAELGEILKKGCEEA